MAEIFGEIGRVVLPLVADALGVLAPAIATVGDVVSVVIAVLSPLLGLIDAIPEPILAGVAAFVAMRAAVALATTALATAVPALAAVLGPIGLVATAVGVALAVTKSFSASQAEQRAELQASASAFLDHAESIQADIEAMVEQRLASKNQEDDIRRIGVSVREFTDFATSGRTGMLLFTDALERAGEVTPGLADAIREVALEGGNIEDIFDRGSLSTDDFTDSNLGLLESFGDLADSANEAAQAALNKLVNDEKLTDQAAKLAVEQTRNTDGTENYVKALRLVAPETADAVEATADLTEGLGEEESQLIDTEQALNDLLDATLGFLNSQLAAEQANRRFGDSIAEVVQGQADLAAARREHGASSNEAREAEEELAEAIRDARDAALAAAEGELRLAQDRATAAGEKLSAAEQQDIFRSSLERAAAQASGPTREAIQGLITLYDTIPAVKRTEIQVEAAKAEAELKRIIGLLNKDFSVLLRLAGLSSIPGAAAGGTFGGGQLVTVGEAGRELVYVQPGTTATVLPNPATERALSQPVGLDPATMAALERIATQPTIAATIAVAPAQGGSSYDAALEVAAQLRTLAARLR